MWRNESTSSLSLQSSLHSLPHYFIHDDDNLRRCIYSELLPYPFWEILPTQSPTSNLLSKLCKKRDFQAYLRQQNVSWRQNRTRFPMFMSSHPCRTRLLLVLLVVIVSPKAHIQTFFDPLFFATVTLLPSSQAFKSSVGWQPTKTLSKYIRKDLCKSKYKMWTEKQDSL